jgi:HSP20 family protein
MSIFKKKKEISQTKDWFSLDNEGELTIDAYETDKDFVIQSTIAGVSAKDIEISVEEDMLIIKGTREKPKETEEEKNYFQQECFWGAFSKKIILPEKINISQTKAVVKNGILTLHIPKTKKSIAQKVTIKDK